MLKENIKYKRFVWEFSNILKNNKRNKNLIFLCIGTNKVIGDSIGPLVGTNLKRDFKNNMKFKEDYNIEVNCIKIFGDMINNVSYNNIEENIQNIKNTIQDSYVIVIDSALSTENNIGKIFVYNKGLKYAESLKRDKEIIGDMSIKVVVGKNAQNRFKNFKILKNISSQRVIMLSNIVSKGIIDAMCLVE